MKCEHKYSLTGKQDMIYCTKCGKYIKVGYDKNIMWKE